MPGPASLPDPLPWSSPRLTLRRLRPDDLPAFQAYRHDPEVWRYQGWDPVPDAEALAFLTEMEQAPFGVPGEWLQIAIAAADGDGLLGTSASSRWRRAARPSSASRSPARRRAAASPRRPPAR